MNTALDILGAAVGVAVLVGILLTVALVARGRPSQPPMSSRQASRITGRNLRVWQRGVNADIRRQGRRPARRTPRA